MKWYERIRCSAYLVYFALNRELGLSVKIGLSVRNLAGKKSVPRVVTES